MLLLGGRSGPSGGREDEGRSLPRVVDQFLSLFGHVDPVHRNPRFILLAMIKEVVMQGLHINNTANTKVRGKGRGASFAFQPV